MHRLRSAEAFKLSLLQHDMDELSGDMESINAFQAALEYYQPNSGGAGAISCAPPVPPLLAHQQPRNPLPHQQLQAPPWQSSLQGTTPWYDHLPLLSQCAFMLTTERSVCDFLQLCGEADRLVDKPIKTRVDVSYDDFDRETAVRLQALQQLQGMEELVAEKDRMIMQLVREKEAAADDMDQVSRASKDELSLWARCAECAPFCTAHCCGLTQVVTTISSTG